MRYRHITGQETTDSQSTSFMLARKAGGYVFLGQPNTSHYQGLTVLLPWQKSWDLFKTVHSLALDTKPHTIALHPDALELLHHGAHEHWAVHDQAVTYSVRNYRGSVHVALDMRRIHDFTQWGRTYSIQEVPGGQVVTYRCPEYSFCLALIGARARFQECWREVQYFQDATRGGQPSGYVNDCLTFECSGELNLRFGTGYTPAAALAAASSLAPQHHDIALPDGDAALTAAAAQLDGLIARPPGLDAAIFAGYPWFYQVWSRDEAISCGGLIALGARDLAKRILLRAIHTIREDGRIPNRFPASDLGSADGVGWAFAGLAQLTDSFTYEEACFVFTQLNASLRGLSRGYIQGLLHSGAQETWMDTTGGTRDTRAGARIEIQALLARMLRLGESLSARLRDGDSERFARQAEELRAAVRAQLFDGQRLADGTVDGCVDWTVRPNIFLAHEAAPELLTDREWQATFSHALRSLWLAWGGLATIDTHDPLSVPEHTGQNDRSYHRGDSWYFVNNVAASALAARGFGAQAAQLLAASERQLLCLGTPGHAAEVSSAGKQEALGCVSQAWSAATYVQARLRPSS